MARGVNKVIIVGNCGQEPEVRKLPDGKAVTSLRVATSDKWKDKVTGAPQERTEWHNVVFYGKLAEIAGQYLSKGSKVYLEGSIKTRSWDDDVTIPGHVIKKYKTEIIASEMQMLDSRSTVASNAPVTSNVPDTFDDDIPF